MSLAHIILRAVRAASDADISALRQLSTHFPNTLQPDLLFRLLLTYLPETTEPNLYTPFLQEVISDSSNAVDDTATLINLAEEIPEAEARRRVRKLRLLPLKYTPYSSDKSIDSFTHFLLHRANQIDSETGSLSLVSQLTYPFVDHSPYLRNWLISTLLPFSRLEYQYYPQKTTIHSLEAFEKLGGSSAIATLLAEALKEDGRQNWLIARDLRGVVGPWIYGANRRKRRKLDTGPKGDSVVYSSLEDTVNPTVENAYSRGWSHVNEWLLDLSTQKIAQAVHAIEQWNGPRDVDYGGWDIRREEEYETALGTSVWRYGQAAFAAIYASQQASLTGLESAHRILNRAAEISGLQSPKGLGSARITLDVPLIETTYLGSLSKVHFLHNALLDPRNPLTTPSQSSVDLAQLLLTSCCVLEDMNYHITCSRAAALSILSDEVEQRAELRKVLYGLRAKAHHDDNVWNAARQQLLWLRDSSYRSDGRQREDQIARSGVFGRICKIEMEHEILKAFLLGGYYDLAKKVYCNREALTIPLDGVEGVVLNVVLASYDGASNGNRTRGGVKKASDMLSSFRKCFPDSAAISKTEALLTATHALSFYSLTLQHGVPFQPVNIRVHPDPLSLIAKILQQNPRSYTKLDHLLEIGQNLFKAGLVEPSPQDASSSLSQDQQIDLSERRVTAMAIEAGLAEEDFDTAYSYIVNRLRTVKPSDQTSSRPGSFSAVGDDVSWRAAYKAGCYELSEASESSRLRRLEQRLELLSQAILLAPISALEDVLATWKECEDEMNIVLAEETEEEEKWDDRGDGRIPGEFSANDQLTAAQKTREPARNAMNEEAPVGLFDVARGAAAALSRNAFPLSRPQSVGPKAPRHTEVSQSRATDPSLGGDVDQGGPGSSEKDGRVRKRDMVSNMVTGGLVSGIGWVIGAPSAREN